MFSFSSQTILAACNNLNKCPAQIGGIISILSLIDKTVVPLTTYLLDSKKLKVKLSYVFDKTPKHDFKDEEESKYIVFSNNWENVFFESMIKEKIDLLSIAIFFLRRTAFSQKITADEIITQFISENNISHTILDTWFVKKNDITIEYNENNIEENQNEFYIARFGTDSFKSITFNSVIQKCAYEFSAAAHIQTLYAGNEIKKSLLYTDEPLDEYYNFKNEHSISIKHIPYSHNRIIFGAPGTGKSYQFDSDLKDKEGNYLFKYYERVTFHPSYTYSNFVGTYKPVKDEKENGQITYEFVEGPFIRVLRQALCDTEENNYLLIVEEINRANVTAVFGDVFQLLDRDSSNISQYEVATSEDLRKHLLKYGVPEGKASVLRIPANMYIWATMNSADQGVQPLDTAFKRRWDFEYLSINEGEKSDTFQDFDITPKPGTGISWNKLRHLINIRLSSNYNISEDKLLGPFFIRKGNKSEEQLINTFKSKVLMYLFEDVCKINPKPLFAGIDKSKLYFSDIVSAFDTSGIDIFKFSDDEVKQAEEEIKEKQADE